MAVFVLTCCFLLVVSYAVLLEPGMLEDKLSGGDAFV
jgi:hypothetical protein